MWKKLCGWIKAAHDRLTGWRTLLLAAALTTIDFVQATDLAPIIPAKWLPYWVTLHPLLFALLRLVTKGPVGASSPGGG